MITTETINKSAPSSRHYHALLHRLQLTSNLSKLAATIGVTGCERRAGVTTVACNMAHAAAEIVSGKVLLVDTNVTNPGVARAFRLKPAGSGFLGCLQSDNSVFDEISETHVPNLSVLPALRAVPGRDLAFELGVFEEIVDTLKHSFHLIIFDLPPVQLPSTTYSLAGSLDGVLLVVDADRSKTSVTTAHKHLINARANVLGAVYNKHS